MLSQHSLQTADAIHMHTHTFVEFILIMSDRSSNHDLGHMLQPTKMHHVRYRTSCDRCQNIKVRCTQEKPSCQRCTHRGLQCVYSPLRRIGRPKKSQQSPSATSDVAMFQPLHNSQSSHPDQLAGQTVAESLKSIPMNMNNKSNSSRQRGRPSNTSLDAAMIEPRTDHHADDRGDDIADDTDYSYTSTNDQTPQTDSTMPTTYDMDTDQDEISNDGAMNDDCSPMKESVGHTALPSGQRLVGPLGSMATYRTIGNASHDANLRDTVDLAAYNSVPTIGSSASDCYIAILSRTAKLEQAIVSAPRFPVSMDILLEAERDLQALAHWSFQCAKSSHGATDQQQNIPSRLADRPLPLAVTLLAETIVSMLEEAFRFAADTAASITTPGIQEPCSNPQFNAMSRRLERSFRGFLDLPCVFPMPAGDFNIRIGEYVVDGPAKARAVKRILQRRTRRLIEVLSKLGEILSCSGQASSLLSSTATLPPQRQSTSFGGLLDWGGSTLVMNGTARQLAKDLIRRLEAVQGGLALTG